MDFRSEIAKSQGFRTPSQKVTPACFEYMKRITELRDFIRLFFNLVESAQMVAEKIPKNLTSELIGLERVPYSYSAHSQLVNEIMLSRAVETFDLYLISILKSIFMARPEILKSEGTVDVSMIIELREYDQIVLAIVEKKLHELGHKPLSELQKYIKSRTDINLFGDKQIADKVSVASELRNLIAHNDCRHNEIFERRVKGFDLSGLEVAKGEKIQISDDWMRRASYTLDAVVFEFDENVKSKFGIEAWAWDGKLKS